MPDLRRPDRASGAAAIRNGARAATRRIDCALLLLALQILDPYETPHRSGRPAGTLDVRLALRVVHRFLGPSTALTTYWEEATASPRFANQTCAHPYFAMRRQLVLKGWDLDCKGVRWRGV